MTGAVARASWSSWPSLLVAGIAGSCGTPSRSRSCPRRRPPSRRRPRSPSPRADGQPRRTRRSGRQPTTGLVLYPGGKVPAGGVRAASARADRRARLPRRDRRRCRSTSRSSGSIRAGDRSSPATRRSTHWAVGGHSLGGSMAAQYIDCAPGRGRRARPVGLVLGRGPVERRRPARPVGLRDARRRRRRIVTGPSNVA